MHYCDCKGTTKPQLLQRVFQRMLTNELTKQKKPPMEKFHERCILKAIALA